MDLNRFKSVISVEINKSALHSLKIQNHIYGCFVLMEDIAQSTVDISGDEVVYPEFTFSLDNQFGEIGKKYGFVSDERILLGISGEYKELWLETFHYIDMCRDIEEVDKIEDAIIDLCKGVPQEVAFFNNALATGLLSKEWIEKVLALLQSLENQEEITGIPEQMPEKKKNLLNTTRGKKIRRSTPKRRFLNKTIRKLH